MWSTDSGWVTSEDGGGGPDSPVDAGQSGQNQNRDTVMEGWANKHGFELHPSLMIKYVEIGRLHNYFKFSLTPPHLSFFILR